MRFAYIRTYMGVRRWSGIERKSIQGRYGASGQEGRKEKKATGRYRETESVEKEKKSPGLIDGISENMITVDYYIQKRGSPYMGWNDKEISKLIKDLPEVLPQDGERAEVHIYRLQIRKKRGPHIHILVNRVSRRSGRRTDIFFSECWKKVINFRSSTRRGILKIWQSIYSKTIENGAKEARNDITRPGIWSHKEPKKRKVINQRRRNLVDKQGEWSKAPKGYYIDRILSVAWESTLCWLRL